MLNCDQLCDKEMEQICHHRARYKDLATIIEDTEWVVEICELGVMLT
jgi:hypothetical protein